MPDASHPDRERAAMPLVVVSGRPCAGKSRVVAELKDELGGLGIEAVVVGDSSLGLDPNELFRDLTAEKMSRGLLKSSVDKALSRTATVIVDSCNGNKGYRYELWCIARLVQTHYCLLFVDTPEEQCRVWNGERAAAERYTPEALDDALFRFEIPDSRNRWEAPQVTVRPLAGPESVTEGVREAAALVDPNSSSPQRGAAATVLSKAKSVQPAMLSETNLLHRISEASRQVMDRVLEEQANCPDGPPPPIDFGHGDVLRLERQVLLPELRRMQRNHLRLMTKTVGGAVPDEVAARKLFVEYVREQHRN